MGTLRAMLKLMAVLRTAFLVFMVGYLLWALPLALMSSPEGKAGDISVKLNLVERVASVAWLALGWIALETALSWARLWNDRRKKAAPMGGRPQAPGD